MLRSGKLFLFLTFLFARQAFAAEIRIGLFNGSAVEAVVFSVAEGEYELMADGKKIAGIPKGTMFYIELERKFLAISDTGHSYGSYSTLAFLPKSEDCVFLVRPVMPAARAKESDDKLEIAVINNRLTLINTLDLEKYIPGTVESEGGSGALPEYYKAQAVLARTYAIRNFSRHAHEGFNLCDGVHCQAYNGKSRMNREIYNATKKTADEILTDKTGQPVITAYHANCGGQTGSSEMVWNRSLYYLQPVKDPFCDQSANRNWNKTILKPEWTAYLDKKGYTDDPATTFSVEKGRQKFLVPDIQVLPMSDIRQDFALKSAWFHLESSGNTVIFSGHGYGHGLGLCQQGAMEMARKGYSYVDILMFYFRGVQLKTRPTE